MEAKGAEPIRRATLSSGAYDAIRSLILDHTFEPHSKLSIDELASILGVSQTPIREALSRLAAEGLALYEPLVGYHVAPELDTDRFDQLMQARFTIEPALAGLAAQNCDRVDARQLRGDAVIGDGSGGDDYERFRHQTDRDALFHAALAEVSGNLFLIDAMASMRAHLHIYRLHLPQTGPSNTTNEHLAIVEAVLAGDATEASEAMRRHLEASYRRHSAGLTS